jgi:ribosomal protein S18 acetylase RimI-like enzyme
VEHFSWREPGNNFDTKISDGLFQVWKDAFDEDDSYLRFIINHVLTLGYLLIYGQVTAPIGALILFPITFTQNGESFFGYYLYALGTLKKHRGKGYGNRLVTIAKEFAIKQGRHFILLQPTNNALFDYYFRLGYQTPVYRSSITYNRRINYTFPRTVEQGTALIQRLSLISAPLIQNPKSSKHLYNRFEWDLSMLGFISKECFFRGGVVFDGAYCYPNMDDNYPYVEVKEFVATSEQIPSFMEKLCTTFPNIDRFTFYGKSQEMEQPGLHQEPFALLLFLNPDLKEHSAPLYTYFALGLD